MAARQRIDHLDVAKGVAMLAIVAGHMGFASPHNVFYNLVFQFHVPLFFILAGYTLTTRQPVVAFVRKKARRLLVPYAVICVVLVAITIALRLVLGHTQPPTQFYRVRACIEACLTGAGSFALPLPEGQTIVGAIWFLEALFWALVEVRLCLEVPRLAPVIVAVLFAVGIKTTTRVFVPLNIQQGMIAALYVYLGYLMASRELLVKRPPLPALVACATIAVVGAWNGVFVSLVRAYLGPHCLGFVTSITTSLLVVSAAMLISEHAEAVKRLLVWVGRNSLAFLGTHLVLLDCGLRWVLEQLGQGMPVQAIRITDFVLQLSACVAVAFAVNGIGSLLRSRKDAARA